MSAKALWELLHTQKGTFSIGLSRDTVDSEQRQAYGPTKVCPGKYGEWIPGPEGPRDIT